ncbi:MAG: hypothetical protein LBJ08_04210, partial [Bifidobacteriaceae bacterium]|nr:hypothetical protein [Bifidobacteriaceae bacterium]
MPEDQDKHVFIVREDDHVIVSTGRGDRVRPRTVYCICRDNYEEVKLDPEKPLFAVWDEGPPADGQDLVVIDLVEAKIVKPSTIEGRASGMLFKAVKSRLSEAPSDLEVGEVLRLPRVVSPETTFTNAARGDFAWEWLDPAQVEVARDKARKGERSRQQAKEAVLRKEEA